jgi:hypothetical protein
MSCFCLMAWWSPIRGQSWRCSVWRSRVPCGPSSAPSFALGGMALALHSLQSSRCETARRRVITHLFKENMRFAICETNDMARLCRFRPWGHSRAWRASWGLGALVWLVFPLAVDPTLGGWLVLAPGAVVMGARRKEVEHAGQKVWWPPRIQGRAFRDVADP